MTSTEGLLKTNAIFLVKINMYETLEEFFLAEALEYITAWQQATESKPAGICGPIGPTEQLPLVAQLVIELNISLKNYLEIAHV